MIHRAWLVKSLVLGSSTFVLGLSIFDPQEAARVPSNVRAYVAAVESVPESESAAIDSVVRTLEKKVQSRFDEGHRPATRDAHAKHHGCVRAQFEVHPAGLPAELRVGVFSREQTFPAWIRFSNGSGKPQADWIPDGRGMAVKLMNVPGEKLMPDEKDEQTQDFLMINHSRFFAKDAAEYVWLFKNGFTYFASHPGNLGGILPVFFKNVPNPLSVRYWSMTPFALGPTAMKFRATPCWTDSHARVSRQHEDYLRESMSLTLASSEACFDFEVQLHNDSRRLPIEDPTVEWRERRSPFIAVAKIMIPRQSFESAEQMDFCEHLSMTPWHSLPEHRPLGGINRSRKAVYTAISRLRHTLNGQPRREPRP